MAWKLDPAEVTWGEMASSAGVSKGPARGGRARREITLTLTHLPTGISVEKRAIGPFTRRQKQEARARLWEELFTALEEKVARHRRAPGR